VHVCNILIYFSTISKYTTAALSRAKSNIDSDRELSLLERVLAREGEKVASILALDLFLVGVDTVNISYPINGNRLKICNPF